MKQIGVNRDAARFFVLRIERVDADPHSSGLVRLFDRANADARFRRKKRAQVSAGESLPIDRCDIGAPDNAHATNRGAIFIGRLTRDGGKTVRVEFGVAFNGFLLLVIRIDARTDFGVGIIPVFVSGLAPLIGGRG